MMTHTLPGCHAGTVVHQDVGEDGEEHLEALVRFVVSAQLNAEEDEEGGGSCLLLGATCGKNKVTNYTNNFRCNQSASPPLHFRSGEMCSRQQSSEAAHTSI